MFSTNKMSIRGKILLFMLLLLLIPSAILGILVTRRLIILSDQNADDSSLALLEEELAQLNRTVTNQAERINQVFLQSIYQVTMLDIYAEALFNGEINISNYHSYWWNADAEFDATGRTIPGQEYVDLYESDQISFDVSAYYMPRNKIPNNDPFTWPSDLGYLLNVSSNLDYMFQNMHEANPNFVWIYASFEGDYSLFRNYPYDSMEWTQFDEEDNPVDPNDDWNPQDEEFYINAINIEDDSTAFTAPYYDPIGLIISMGRPIHFNNGTLIGMVGIDITILTLKQEILNIQVLDDGYAFLVDEEGSTIMHPDLGEEFETITALEIGDDTQELNQFNSIVNKMTSGQRGTEKYTKNGVDWYICYAPVPTTKYSLALVVPESNIIAPAMAIRDTISRATVQQVLIMLVILIVAIILIIFLGLLNSNRIVKPIKDVTKMANLVANGDLSRDFKDKDVLPRELAVFHSTFDNLLTSLRYGNKDYYRGDLHRAYNNYVKALELFKTTNNLRGIALTKNNLANVHRARKEFQKAEQLYLESIEIGKQMNDYVGLASRYNNLGLLMLDRGQFQLAKNHIELALQYDQRSNNSQGNVIHKNNLGLMYLQKGEVKFAYRMFSESLALAENIGFERGIAISKLNIGVYYLNIKNYDEAEKFLEQSLAIGKDIRNVNIVKQSLSNLVAVFKARSDIKKVRLYESMYNELKRRSFDKKLVFFVIDYSGSMQGKRIDAAVEGALSVFNTQINPQDEVGIITFDTYSRVVLDLTPVEENRDKITNKINRLRNPHGATSFYDALGDAFNILANRTGNEQRWIIALTDGEDNSSRRYNITQRSQGLLSSLLGIKDKSIQKLISESFLNINLIVIGVGRGLRRIENKIIRLTKEAPRGKYIPIHQPGSAHRAIQNAFHQVREMLSQVDVEGVDFENEY